MPDEINHLSWGVIDGVLAGMPVPYVSAERRMNHGGCLDAFEDALPLLYRAGIRAVVCMLNAPSDDANFTSDGFKLQSCPVGY